MQTKLRTKILLLILSVLVGLLILVVLSAFEIKNALMDGRKEALRSVLQVVHSSLSNYQARVDAGEIKLDEAKKLGRQLLENMRFGGESGNTEYVYAFTTAGVGIYHPNKDRLTGENMFEKIRDPKGNYTWKDVFSAAKSSPEGGFLTTVTVRPATKEFYDKLGFARTFEPWSWVLGTGATLDDINKEYRSKLMVNIFLSLAVMLFISFLGLLTVRAILRQVGGEPQLVIHSMSVAASGDMTVVLPNAPTGSMIDSLREMLNSFKKIIFGITETSSALTKGADKINNASQEVADDAKKQSDATLIIATSVGQMTTSINHISASCKIAQEHMLSLVNLSEEGVTGVKTASLEIKHISTNVHDASKKIRDLEERAKHISSIANVIKEIAAQTNLLALNAAIEAARAGEQGRGFAVVADEVRKLAERTSSATVEIEKMIVDIQSDTANMVNIMDASLPQVEAGVRASDEAATTLNQVKESIQASFEQVSAIVDATLDLSTTSDDISHRIDAIANMAEKTSATMHSTFEIVKGFEAVVATLNKNVGNFRVT